MVDFADFIVPNPDTAWREAGKPKRDLVEDGRKQTAAYIDKALGQIAAGEDNPARGAYKTKGEFAQVVVKAGRKIVVLGGNERNVVPREKLKEFLEAVKDAVMAGQIDSQLGGGEPVATNDRRSKPWSPERKAAHAERLKASWAERNANAPKSKKAKPGTPADA